MRKFVKILLGVLGAVVVIVVATVLFSTFTTVKHQVTSAKSLIGSENGYSYVLSFDKSGSYTATVKGGNTLTIVSGSFDNDSDDDILIKSDKLVNVSYHSSAEMNANVPYEVDLIKHPNGDAGPASAGIIKKKGSKLQLNGITLTKSSKPAPVFSSEYSKAKKQYAKLYGQLYKSVLGTDSLSSLIAFKDDTFTYRYFKDKDGDQACAFASGTFSYKPKQKKFVLAFEKKTPLYHGAIDTSDDLTLPDPLEYSTKEDFPFNENKVVLKLDEYGTMVSSNKFFNKMNSQNDNLVHHNSSNKDLLAIDPSYIRNSAVMQGNGGVRDDGSSSNEYENLSDDEKVQEFVNKATYDITDQTHTIYRDLKATYDFTSDSGKVVYKLYEPGDDTSSPTAGFEYGYDPSTGDLYRYTYDSGTHWNTEQFASMNCPMPTH